MGTLTDDDLRHLLGEAGASFAVPQEGADEVLAQAPLVPLHRRRWLQVPAAAAVVAGAVLAGVLVAGGAQDEPRIDRLAGDVQPGVDRQSGTRYSAEDESALKESDSGRTTGGVQPAAADLALRAAAPAAPGAKVAPPVGAPVPDGARVVKTGAIELIVDDGQVTPTLTKVQALASGVGGVVANAKTQESGPTPSGSVTLRVPVDAFEEVVARVRGLGAEVRSATTSGQDVTAQYADLEAQIRTLRAARERFLEILANARTIGDVLAVQQRVDDVTGKLDRLEGQRRVLAAQSDSGTIEVTVTEADDPALGSAEQPDDGLGTAFSDAWEGFTSGVEGLIRLSGRAVLLLLCLGAALLVFRVGWRASRRRLV